MPLTGAAETGVCRSATNPLQASAASAIFIFIATSTHYFDGNFSPLPERWPSTFELKQSDKRRAAATDRETNYLSQKSEPEMNGGCALMLSLGSGLVDDSSHRGLRFGQAVTMSTKDARHVSIAALNYLLIALLAVCLMATGAAIARLLT